MVEHVVHFVKVGIVVHEPLQGLACHGVVSDLVLLQDSGIVQGIAQQVMRLLHLFLGVGYLVEVVFAVVGVTRQRIAACLFLLVNFRDIRECRICRVAGIRHIGTCISAAECTAVCPAPVVLVASPAPLPLEYLASTLYCIGVGIVPCIVGGLPGCRRAVGRGCCACVGSLSGILVLHGVLVAVSAGFFFLFLLQLLYQAVCDGNLFGLA